MADIPLINNVSLQVTGVKKPKTEFLLGTGAILGVSKKIAKNVSSNLDVRVNYYWSKLLTFELSGSIRATF